MIRYVRGGWFAQLYRWRGGACEKIWRQVLAYGVYCYCIYVIGGDKPIIRDSPGSLKLLGGFATFSLVFTLNQCYSRYTEGVHLTAQLFGSLLGLNTMACSYAGTTKGCLENLAPAEMRLTVATQVHVARLSLALGVAFAVHRYIIESAVTGKAITDDCHVAILFELTRLRGLLLDPELPLVDGSTGLLVQRRRGQALGCCACCGTNGCSSCSGRPQADRLRVNFRYKSGSLSPELRPLFPPAGGRPHRERHSAEEVMGASLILPLAQLLRHHVAASANQKWGYPEKFLNLFEGTLQKVMVVSDALEQLVSMPLPMAYLQQRKNLFIAFVMVYPLTLPNSDGLWTNVITPSLIFMAMMGFESVAEMLENPLGSDSLDLNIGEMLHDLEVRVSKVLGFAEERLGAMEEASSMLLERMPLKEDCASPERKEKVASLRRLSQEWGFNAHFAWRPVPPQVFVQALSQMHAVGHQADEELRKHVLQRQLSDSSESGASDCSSHSSDEESGRDPTQQLFFSREEAYIGPQKSARQPKRGRRKTSAQEAYRSVALMRAHSEIDQKDLLGIDHFLCLRSRAPAIDALLEEFGREYVRDKKRKGAGGRLLSRLHDLWWPHEGQASEVVRPHR